MLAWVLGKLFKRLETLEARQQGLSETSRLPEPDQWIREGYALQSAGRLNEAEAVYRKILFKYPRHADTLYLFSEIRKQAGDIKYAISLCEKAIEANSGIAAFHASLGELRRRQGDIPGAEAALREATNLDPQNPEYVNDLGTTLLHQERHDEALGCFEKALAIDPDLPQALYNVGMVHFHRKKYAEAAKSVEQALTLQPDHHKGFLALGDIYIQANKPERALESYAKAMSNEKLRNESSSAVMTAIAEAHIGCGNNLLEQKRPMDAMVHFLQAAKLDPTHPRSFGNMALALKDAENCEWARQIIADVQKIAPDITWEEHGDSFCEIDIALGLANYALSLDSNDAAFYVNKSALLEARGQYDQALALVEKAAEMCPELEHARHNRGIMLLRKGAFARGWEEYDWRLQLGDNTRNPNLKAAPLWEGEPLHDKTLLIHTEQGLGDTIQFIRYYREAASRCKNVILQCQPQLKTLLQALPGASNVFSDGEPLPKFDYQIPLLTLPRVVGTRLETIPADIPYIHPDPERVAGWNKTIAQCVGLKVGLVWAGGKIFKGDRQRSCRLETLAPLASVPAVSFVSLQKGEPSLEAKHPPSGMNFFDFTDQLTDFVDTAALISALDLVITVDTSVAHLAGALGKPVWVLIPFVSDWRWLLEREDSPWYPSMRLFRQARMGDWTECVMQIRRELNLLAGRAGKVH